MAKQAAHISVNASATGWHDLETLMDPVRSELQFTVNLALKVNFVNATEYSGSLN